MATITAASASRPPLALQYHIGKLFKYRYLPHYLWYHKLRFGVNNTKFDITFCVFRESFLRDQYGIRSFLDRMTTAPTLTFVDLGRNHGLVFYYMMYYIMIREFPVKTINYYGVDPSPLKFVYFNFHDWLRQRGIAIHYHIIDRAVVFDDAAAVTLSYGERNFGNFHVAGSNYAERVAHRQSRYEFVDITVDTIRFDEIIEIVRSNLDSDAMIVKIDCKNRTDHMFGEIRDVLDAAAIDYHIAAEHDRSSTRDLTRFRSADGAVLVASRAGGRAA